MAGSTTEGRKVCMEAIPVIMAMQIREDMTVDGGTEPEMRFPPGLEMMMPNAVAGWTGKKQALTVEKVPKGMNVLQNAFVKMYANA